MMAAPRRWDVMRRVADARVVGIVRSGSPDDAWQTFLDANVYPDGLIDSVQSISFK